MTSKWLTSNKKSTVHFLSSLIQYAVVWH
jgi:hypothetical protein